MLFERLAGGHAAGVTVVTPNRRLAQALLQDFDSRQLHGGLSTWETADVLPFSAFVARSWEDALYSPEARTLPLLLTPAQEQALWEEVIRGSAAADMLLSVSGTASQCQEAWQLAHAWQLMPALASTPLNEDARAFLEWSSQYVDVTRQRNLIDGARLPDALVPLLDLKSVRKPATLVLFGFDTVTPQQRTLMEALAGHGVGIAGVESPPVRSQVRRVEFTSAKDELLAAARWARARLENGARRIGVVVPDLAQCRSLVQRTFANVLQPASVLPAGTASGSSAPFELSLGLPLAGYPMVHDALLALELTCGELRFNDVSRLILSPHLAGAEMEMAVRARVDVALRERCGVTVGLKGVQRLLAMDGVPQAPVLVERFSRLGALAGASGGRKPVSEWAQIFAEALNAVGFPGERTLDSSGYQTLKKWHEVLAALATLERVTGRMDCRHALNCVRRLAADTLFQPETPQVPIQVLGVLESAGLNFDHLWVMGLTDETWPLPARPNPFVPVRLQREAGIPYADAAASLERGRRMTQDWFGAAPEVIVSCARMRDDSELSPSPLIAALEPTSPDTLAIPAYDTVRETLHRAFGLETVTDGAGPPLPVRGDAETGPGAAFGGGTAVFKDQAACPFRAFARHRLDSAPLETPQPGLDPADRGNLLHFMLAAVWTRLGDKRHLDALDSAGLDALLQACAAEAVGKVQRFRPDAFEPRFAAIEQARLVKLTREWLEVERVRPEFSVTAIERKRPVSFGGVTVNAKLDRMDTLASGERVVIDYKTGRCAVSAWLGERPEEPQLPLYALGAEATVSGVAFAQLRTGELKFLGLADTEGLLPGVTSVAKNRSPAAKQYADWSDLVRGWETELAALGRGFAAGDARVDPKRGDLTCQFCDQHAFCRVAEKALAPTPPANGEVGDE